MAIKFRFTGTMVGQSDKFRHWMTIQETIQFWSGGRVPYQGPGELIFTWCQGRSGGVFKFAAVMVLAVPCNPVLTWLTPRGRDWGQSWGRGTGMGGSNCGTHVIELAAVSKVTPSGNEMFAGLSAAGFSTLRPEHGAACGIRCGRGRAGILVGLHALYS